ncbi:hypothetical protein R4P64_30375 [Rhodococcus sp. IEGM 1366]|uniref:hypothetical protein n=1 Tax=Rhodococcus sp. IEGM 1366 TaxID=3082223 RepID=UPI0029539D40|nr:hypothetical protein [Rhodococcus sp. IEGM 1366]MDV8070834.1 hypothetical protein [Rhodococcus sp. IEGM 1366]
MAEDSDTEPEGIPAGLLGSVRIYESGRELLSAPRRLATVTVLVFAGLGLLCGLLGAAVLWWYASRPFTIYTASYEPSGPSSIRIDGVSVYRYIAGLIVGGPILGTVFGALVYGVGWNLMRRERTKNRA